MKTLEKTVLTLLLLEQLPNNEKRRLKIINCLKSKKCLTYDVQRIFSKSSCIHFDFQIQIRSCLCSILKRTLFKCLNII